MKKQITTEDDREFLYKGIAPQIIGNYVLKQFLLLQMFANPENKNEKLNYIIIGPASSGKSEVSRFASKVNNISRYTRDPTIAGLKENLIACDTGVLFYEEFDKSSRKQRNTLLEALSDGVTTIDKHDEHFPYPSRISLTALANPLTSQLSRNPLSQQLSFSKEDHLMTRFHFIIPVVPPELDLYEQIAVNSEMKWSEDQMIKIMRDNIRKIKEQIPVVSIPERLRQRIGAEVKSMDMKFRNILHVTPRLLYGFLSATKARSRWMGRDTAKEEDFEYVLELFEEVVNGRG